MLTIQFNVVRRSDGRGPTTKVFVAYAFVPIPHQGD
ncbi:MAG: hypothetical protein JWM95_4348 [Gemmatimonadetes bacterium]|nr:hypothetical protein [Gemmatimonadota bacterium]